MNRRGFLSLLVATPAALAVERVLASPAVAPLVESAEPAQLRMFVMPFAPELGFQEIVEPGGIVRLVARPQLLFQPRRLMFAPGTDLAKFSLLQVNARGENELAGAIPAEVFEPRGYMAPLEFSRAMPGEEIILALRNDSNVEAEFKAAAMVGLAVT